MGSNDPPRPAAANGFSKSAVGRGSGGGHVWMFSPSFLHSPLHFLVEPCSLYCPGGCGTLRTQSSEGDAATGRRLVPVQGLSLRVRPGVGLGFPS